jgi:hypothetical protein
MTQQQPQQQYEQSFPTVKTLALIVGGIDKFTCYDCPLAVGGCEFAWDVYNTDGDCLAEK